MNGLDGAARLAVFFEHASRSGPQNFCLGEVLEAGQGRLRISCCGLALLPEDLYFADFGYSYHWTEDTGDPLLLRKGDRVILLTAEGEDFYLLAKAVRA